MDRDAALAFVQGMGFNDLMVKSGRQTTDSPSGYGPALDRAFAAYTAFKESTVALTTVSPADLTCFEVMLEANIYDLILPNVAMMVDFSVDAPLTSAKFSQQFKSIERLADRAWERAATCGYDVLSLAGNMSGMKANLDFLEPSGITVAEYS